MKNITKLIVIILALNINPVSAIALGGLWQSVDVLNINDNHLHVTASSPEHFVTVGRRSGIAYSFVKKSEDGGVTWTTILEDTLIIPDAGPFRIPKKYFSASMPDNDAIFISSDSGIVFRSFNSGQSWDTLYVGMGGPVNIIDMIDRDNGVIVVHTVNILHTTNGGDTWEAIPLSREITNGGVQEMIFFENKDLLILLSLSNDHKIVARTSDFGANWQEWEFNGRIGFDFSFVSPLIGWSADSELTGVGTRAYDVIRHTTDGGATWQLQLRDEIGELPFGLKSCSFADDQYGIAGGLTGKLLHTTNGGVDWIQIPSGIDAPSSFDVESIAYPTRDVAVAVTNAGGILRYDANATSVTDFPHTKQALSRVYPNPVGAAAVLVLTGYHSGGVDLFNAQGVLVKEIAVEPWDVDSEAGSVSLEVDTSGLTAGVYFAGYTTSDNQRRFVKFVVGL